MGEAGAGRQTAGCTWDGTQAHRPEGAADAEEGTQRGGQAARAEPAGLRPHTGGAAGDEWHLAPGDAAFGRCGESRPGGAAVRVPQGTVKGLGSWEGWEEVTNMERRPPGDRVGAG